MAKIKPYYARKLKLLNLTASEAARCIDVPPSRLHHHLSGHTRMSEKIREKMETLFRIRKEQLLKDIKKEFK